MRTLFYRTALLTLLVFASCSSPLPYQTDAPGFMTAALANSPEFPIYVNQKLCQDVDGEPGLCSKRVVAGKDIAFHLDPLSYPYDLTMACNDGSQALPAPGPFTVPSNQAFDFIIPASSVSGLTHFICAGGIFPQDRPQPLAAVWDVRFLVVAADYLPREKMQIVQANGKATLILGEYARSSWVFDQGKWTAYSKKTEIEIQDPAHVQAYSESEQMRYNALNLSGPVVVSGNRD